MLLSNNIVVFDKETKNSKWYITNDDVMGGVSNSSIVIDNEGSAIFSGQVSLENNGGFSMVRLPVDISLNSNSSKIVLKIKGDSKKYQLRIKSKKRQRFWYVSTFQTSNKIQKIEIPLKDFYPSFRGYRLNYNNFSGNNIKEIAILIGNKKNENFNLKIEKISIK